MRDPCFHWLIRFMKLWCYNGIRFGSVLRLKWQSMVRNRGFVINRSIWKVEATQLHDDGLILINIVWEAGWVILDPQPDTILRPRQLHDFMLLTQHALKTAFVIEISTQVEDSLTRQQRRIQSAARLWRYTIFPGRNGAVIVVGRGKISCLIQSTWQWARKHLRLELDFRWNQSLLLTECSVNHLKVDTTKTVCTQQTPEIFDWKLAWECGGKLENIKTLCASLSVHVAFHGAIHLLNDRAINSPPLIQCKLNWDDTTSLKAG